MTLLCILLSLFCVVELVILIVVLRRALIVTIERENLYNFFEDTLEDIDGVISTFDKLMQRQLVSDDPDIQSIYRLIGIMHDILLEYRNAGSKGRKEKRKE